MRRVVIAVRVLYASACAMLEYSSMSVNRVYALELCILQAVDWRVS